MNELFIAITAGLGGMLGWGFSDFFAAKAIKLQKITEIQANFTLWLMTSVFMWALVILTGQSLQVLTLNIIVQLFVFTAMNMAAYLLFFRALHIGNLSTISTIFSTYAVGATIISILFFGEYVTPFRLLALFIIFLGIAAVSIQNTKKLTAIKGLGQILAAALLFAIFFPLWDNFLVAHGGAIFWVAWVDSLVALFFYIYIKFKKLRVTKISTTVSLAALANAIAIGLTNWGFATTSMTSVIVVVASGVPLISAILGYKVLKERLILIQYIGIAGILFGVILLFGS